MAQTAKGPPLGKGDPSGNVVSGKSDIRVLNHCAPPTQINSSRNPLAVQAAIADLTIECSIEAAHVASVTARHFLENMEIGDLWAAEHSLGLAVRHLREAAGKFREWQRLKASAKEARHA